MSTVASEKKKGIVVYLQRVFQTVTSLRVVSLLFRGHDLLKIPNINTQQAPVPSKKPHFRSGKKLVLRESGGNGAYV